MDNNFNIMNMNESIRCAECYHLQRKVSEMEIKHHKDYLMLKKQIIAKSCVIEKFKAVTAQNAQLTEQVKNLKKLIQKFQLDCKKLEDKLAENLKVIEPLKQENKTLKKDYSKLQETKDDLSIETQGSQKLIEQLQTCISALKEEAKQETNLAKQCKKCTKPKTGVTLEDNIEDSQPLISLLINYVDMSSNIMTNKNLVKRASPISRLLNQVKKGIQLYNSKKETVDLCDEESDESINDKSDNEFAGSKIESLLLEERVEKIIPCPVITDALTNTTPSSPPKHEGLLQSSDDSSKNLSSTCKSRKKKSKNILPEESSSEENHFRKLREDTMQSIKLCESSDQFTNNTMEMENDESHIGIVGSKIESLLSEDNEKIQEKILCPAMTGALTGAVPSNSSKLKDIGQNCGVSNKNLSSVCKSRKRKSENVLSGKSSSEENHFRKLREDTMQPIKLCESSDQFTNSTMEMENDESDIEIVGSKIESLLSEDSKEDNEKIQEKILCPAITGALAGKVPSNSSKFKDIGQNCGVSNKNLSSVCKREKRKSENVLSGKSSEENRTHKLKEDAVLSTKLCESSDQVVRNAVKAVNNKTVGSKTESLLSEESEKRSEMIQEKNLCPVITSALTDISPSNSLKLMNPEQNSDDSSKNLSSMCKGGKRRSDNMLLGKSLPEENHFHKLKENTVQSTKLCESSDQFANSTMEMINNETVGPKIESLLSEKSEESIKNTHEKISCPVITDILSDAMLSNSSKLDCKQNSDDSSKNLPPMRKENKRKSGNILPEKSFSEENRFHNLKEDSIQMTKLCEISDQLTNCTVEVINDEIVKSKTKSLLSEDNNENIKNMLEEISFPVITDVLADSMPSNSSKLEDLEQNSDDSSKNLPSLCKDGKSKSDNILPEKSSFEENSFHTLEEDAMQSKKSCESSDQLTSSTVKVINDENVGSKTNSLLSEENDENMKNIQEKISCPAITDVLADSMPSNSSILEGLEQKSDDSGKNLSSVCKVRKGKSENILPGTSFSEESSFHTLKKEEDKEDVMQLKKLCKSSDQATSNAVEVNEKIEIVGSKIESIESNEKAVSRPVIVSVLTDTPISSKRHQISDDNNKNSSSVYKSRKCENILPGKSSSDENCLHKLQEDAVQPTKVFESGDGVTSTVIKMADKKIAGPKAKSRLKKESGKIISSPVIENILADTTPSNSSKLAPNSDDSSKNLPYMHKSRKRSSESILLGKKRFHKLTEDTMQPAKLFERSDSDGNNIQLDNSAIGTQHATPCNNLCEAKYPEKVTTASDNGNKLKANKEPCSKKSLNSPAKREASNFLFAIKSKRRKCNVKAASWYAQLPNSKQNAKPSDSCPTKSKQKKNKPLDVEKILEIMKLPERYQRPVSPIPDLGSCSFDTKNLGGNTEEIQESVNGDVALPAEDQNELPALCNLSDKALFGESSEDSGDAGSDIHSSHIMSRQSSCGFDVSNVFD